MEITISKALGLSVLGITVVFAVLIFLMLVIILISRCARAFETGRFKASSAAVTEETAVSSEKLPAPGSCGQLKLYNVQPRDAAMIMAIVADELKTPLNQLRFISIKEVEQHEI